jgi:hypothetical protein
VDGGKTWAKSLSVKVGARDIGAVDVVMDPKNPAVLYAAAYDKVRKPWTFADGGPGSGIYKTIDAGKSWTKLAAGLPQGWMGRIGLSIARNDPNTVYAVIENLGTLDEPAQKRYLEGFGNDRGDAQMFRTDDAGKSWRQVAPAPVAPAPPGAAPAGAAGRGGGGGGRGGFDGGNPPYYYGQVRVDPNDKEHVFVLSVGWSQSRDGGKTWQGMGFGGDNHSLWINPRDSQHMMLGYDHGFGTSFDGGQSWLKPDNIPTAQFYAVGIDMAVPYNVYGGLQDNGCHKGPSTMRGGGTILPTVAVHDLKIHPRDRELVVATHGRGIFIADISEVEELTPAVLAADAHLFEIDPVIDWEAPRATVAATINFAGMSRPTDMGISYYLRSDVSGDVKVRVYDSGRMIAEMDGPKTAGINTVRWNLQARRDRIEGEAGRRRRWWSWWRRRTRWGRRRSRGRRGRCGGCRARAGHVTGRNWRLPRRAGRGRSRILATGANRQRPKPLTGIRTLFGSKVPVHSSKVQRSGCAVLLVGES